MDYQIVSKPRHQCYIVIAILLIFKLLPYCLCIVNRDLVLTPKQGLQLSGKRIFYEESNNNESSSFHKNSTAVHATEVRPWERTLKHVTYLTLFTNAANGIITGNFSKVKEYNNFLNSSYIRSTKSIDSRFGDIVLLAEGRLELMSNGSYRFMEGECDYECARENNIVALWHVQKIRHRDTADRKYHYEMKFSVSPVTTKAPTETIVRGGPNKRTIMEEQKNNVQTFIQTQDDYPQSFEKIIPSDDEDFSKRRYDAARNFRQVNQRSPVQQVTPIPQSTFLRGIYRNPPPHPKPQLQQQPQHHITHAHNIPPHLHQHQIPQAERLNTGEFYQGNYGSKASPKIELFPSLLNMFMSKPQRPLPPPTTFRPPTSQMKFPRPEIYALHQQPTQEFHKFHDFTQPYSPEQFKQTVPTSVPLVTHHYHHHYFMANNSGISLEQVIQHNSAEHKQEQIYHNEVAGEITPQHYITTKYDEPLTTTLRYQQSPQQNFQNKLNIQPQPQQQSHSLPQFQHQNQHQINYQQSNYNQNPYQDYQLMPPAPQKFIFPNTQIEQQHVVHVTSTPLLKKPQYQQQQQQQSQPQPQPQPQQYDSYPYTTALEYTTVNIPLLISYPATLNEGERMDVPTPRNKPFLQSEPIGETIRYSEPDPLYANINENDENVNRNQYIPSRDHHQDRNNQEPQLEIPEHDKRYQQQKTQQAVTEADSKREHSESIEAQLPTPINNNQPTEVQLNNVEISKDLNEKEITHESEQNTSQSKTTVQIVDEHTTPNSEKPESLNSIATENPRSKIFSLRKKRIGLKAGNTTSSTTPITIKKPLLPATTTENIKLSTTSKPRKYFVSTSSTESPLRTISRYRNSYARTSTSTTSTTEKPVLKWTPKRKGYVAKSLAIKSTTPAQSIDNEDETESESDESNDNDSIKTDESNNLKNINFTVISTTTITPETTTKASDTLISASSSTTSSSLLLQTSPLTTQTETEIYEVLTQKSVSKSVSLKVGPNGEEIPIIIDDEENEVKNK